MEWFRWMRIQVDFICMGPYLHISCIQLNSKACILFSGFTLYVPHHRCRCFSSNLSMNMAHLYLELLFGFVYKLISMINIMIIIFTVLFSPFLNRNMFLHFKVKPLVWIFRFTFFDDTYYHFVKVSPKIYVHSYVYHLFVIIITLFFIFYFLITQCKVSIDVRMWISPEYLTLSILSVPIPETFRIRNGPSATLSGLRLLSYLFLTNQQLLPSL